ncbi:MAG: GspE/PulE family protein [Gammaproteobacteria bacterium]|nr:GspE/PulE family protein [Gammaproteobacteria bacterium]
MTDLSADSKATQAAAPHRKIRIGDLLVSNGVITEAQLMTALAEQKKTGQKLGYTLIDSGFIDEDRLLQFLSQQLQIPLIDLSTFVVDPQTVRQLPETVARRYRMVVLESRDQDVLLGMADPTDLFAYDEASRLLKKRVRQAVVRESELLRRLSRWYQDQEALQDLAGELHQELSAGDVDLQQMLSTIAAEDAPVVRLLQKLFEEAIDNKASDIHIEPEEKVLRIRQRIDGVLQERVMNEVRIVTALVQRLKLLANLDISEKRLPQDGRFQIKVKSHQVDVRLSTMPVAHGEAVVMRLLDQTSGILRFEELGMPESLRERLRRVIRQPHGMLLVTGPTGSGKTTTLYAALNELNTPQHKIITVEDPVEYRLPRINQVQVHEQIGLTFARVLRTALRQDPDVILVGEMRDLETAQIGLRAAITGHFVLSTLHTNSAVGTISRLVDMGAQGYLIATALEAVLAQRLVRRICPHCAQPHEPDEHERVWLARQTDADAATDGFQLGRGCERCNQSGYQGRVGVYELLEMRGDLLAALRNQDIDGFAAAALADPSFTPLAASALAMARAGVTSLAEAIRVGGDADL